MQGARPFGRVQRRSLTSLGPLWGEGVPPGPGPGPKIFGKILKFFFCEKFFLVQKHILWVPRAQKRVFDQKKSFAQNFLFPGLMCFRHFGPVGPAGPGGPAGPFGHLAHLACLAHQKLTHARNRTTNLGLWNQRSTTLTPSSRTSALPPRPLHLGRI